MNVNNIQLLRKGLVNAKIPYTEILKGQSTKIICKLGKFEFRANNLPKRELYAISEVLKEVDGWYKPGMIKYEKPKYIGISPKLPKNGRFEAVEIDLNSAYWEIAYMEGLISQKVYNLKDKISKKTRLAALGATASISSVSEFDGDTITVKESTQRETAPVYYKISEIVGNIMDSITKDIEKDYFLFWVDAIICKKPLGGYVRERILEYGLNYKDVILEYVEIKEGRVYAKPENKDIKYFELPKRNIIRIKELKAKLERINKRK